jgi:hypothetical protein
MSLERSRSYEEVIVYEYERWQPFFDWGNSYPGYLLPTDPGDLLSQCFRKSAHDPLFSPGRWSDAWGLKFSDNLVQILEPVAEGWTESSFQVIATVVS